MAQQTAVEWFIENIPQRFANALKNEYQDLILEAKQMEKEQIIEAFDCDGSPQPGEVWISNGEQYYNETYGEIDQPPT